MLYLKFSILKFLVLTGLFSHLVFGSQLEAVITAKYEDESLASEVDSTNSAQPCLHGVVCNTRTHFIRDATINPSHWKLNQRVTFSFRTTNEFENIKIVNLVVHEVIERDGSSIPKHVFKGFILRAFTIKPNSRYEATFVPPYFWDSGTYMLTMSVNKQVEDWEKIGGYHTWNSFEEEFIIQVGAEADASFEKVISLPQRLRSENKENRATTNLELDIFRSILGSLRSAFEVCSFCQSFENAHKNCKAIFDTNGPKPTSAVSIGQICSIGKRFN
ncbi:hypothetical protein BKA69DRAFT_1044588 [Paraphysoderma sedebokerense]|nr:hypothetical protein BKA69DRAFT_1044588 [Paraphysoderma sedebokerense]